MVRRGEFLERAVVVSCGDVFLEGLYHRGAKRPGVLIAPPHPERGGSMEIAVANEVAWATARAGHPSLRFNYRGVGASGGTFDDASVLADAEAAARHLAMCLSELDGAPVEAVPLGALGIGYGASMVARLAIARRIDPLILVAPEVDSLPSLEGLDANLLVIAGADDPNADAARLSRVADSAARGRLVRIPRADATWRRGLVELGRVVTETLDPPGELELPDGEPLDTV